MPQRSIRIGNRLIGDGHPAFVIAEIGYNFTTPEEARRSIDAAISAGVDAVKFQTFKAETVTSRAVDFPAEAGGGSQFDEFKQHEISPELHADLFKYARQKGTIVFSTPSYYDDVEMLERLDIPVYKVGSDDLTNLPFIEYVAAKGKPLLFSTGMSTLSEVDEAVAAIRSTGNDQFAILHCVSNYPVRDFTTLNLRAVATLRQAYEVPIGFSDHTTSTYAAVAAVALGANIVERHFTLDKALNVPDASFSADPAEMAELVRAIRQVEHGLGDGIKRPAASETAMRAETRKGVIARVAIRRGDILRAEDYIVKRPGTGIPPKLAHLAAGRRARRDIKADEVISWDMLE